MDITNATAIITGANRGLGRAFAERLLERGAAKVYATARRPETIETPGVTPLRLDVTDPRQIADSAAAAGDVTLLINNAGIQTGADIVRVNLADVQQELDTHFFGTVHMMRAFAPILAANGGGAILNVLSAVSWFSVPGAGAYHVAKAAAWAATNSARLELEAQGTLVTGLHLGLADTDMGRKFDGERTSPLVIVDAALDGIEAGAPEVLADETSRAAKLALAGAPGQLRFA